MNRNRWCLISVVTVFAVGLLVALADDKETTVLKSQKDKLSYDIGVDLGRNFKRDGIDIDPDIVARGVKDVLSGGKLLMTEDEMRAVAMTFRAEMQKKLTQDGDMLAKDNKKAGDAFLAENKGKEGVVTLPSGLQYKIIKAGNGVKPALTNMVECQYRGTLINGTEFDSSYTRGTPATFKVSGVIPGWTEALQLMPVGSKWQLFVPSELAYGVRGAGSGEIGPNATLIFEVELLSIK
jgi:FKBP-type peptidyl-prolyl cis-trans isomerase